MEEESIEVLEYVGFVPSAARLIYERYINRPDPDRNPDDLMQYVFGHIGSLKSRRYDNMSCKEALRQIGLNLQIQEAITDPRFSRIFGTETLHYWAKDTIQTNYAALFSRQRLLSSHANQRIEYKNKRKKSRHQENVPQEQCASQNPAMTTTINMTPDDFRFPEAHVAMQTEVDTLNDHISLYKGKAYEELNREESIVNDDGSINLTPLLTYPGGDTNWDKIAYYWNPEKRQPKSIGNMQQEDVPRLRPALYGFRFRGHSFIGFVGKSYGILLSGRNISGHAGNLYRRIGNLIGFCVLILSSVISALG